MTMLKMVIMGMIMSVMTMMMIIMVMMHVHWGGGGSSVLFGHAWPQLPFDLQHPFV